MNKNELCYKNENNMFHIYTTHKFIEKFIRYILCIYEYKIMALT